MDLLPAITARLTLRRFRDDDLPLFLAYRCDPQVALFQDWSSIDAEAARDFIQYHQRAPFGVPGRWFQIAIVLRETDVLIGDIGACLKADDPTAAEVGITLSRENQGKGFASEALRKVLTIMFDEIRVERIEAVTDSRNLGSIALLRRMGMNRRH